MMHFTFCYWCSAEADRTVFRFVGLKQKFKEKLRNRLNYFISSWEVRDGWVLRVRVSKVHLLRTMNCLFRIFTTNPPIVIWLEEWWAHWPTFSILPTTQLWRPTRHIKTSPYSYSSSSSSSSLIQSMVIQNLLCLGERRPSNTLSDSDGRLFACVFKSLKCVRRLPRSGFCLLWAAAAAGAASGGGSTSTPEIYDTPVPGLLYSKQTGGGGESREAAYIMLSNGGREETITL